MKMAHMMEKGAWFLNDDLTCPAKVMRTWWRTLLSQIWRRRKR